MVDNISNRKRLLSGGFRLFLIYGILSTVLGLAILLFFVDNPRMRILRLTDIERQIVEQRTRDNAVVRHKTVKRYQILEALCEIRYYCLCLSFLAITLQSGGMITFGAQIIHGIGFTVNIFPFQLRGF